MDKRHKTKSQAVKTSGEILKCLLLVGTIYIAASSPYFVFNLMRNIKKFKPKDKPKVNSAFQYLRRNGLIQIKQDGYDIHISLTEKGKKRAGKYQIDDLKIEVSKRWDRKWRMVIFDIPDFSKTARNIFRGKLKKLNFYSLQKSVWVFPFDCKKEIELLRDFLGADNNQIQLVIAEKIEQEERLKRVFNLN